jgi:hypothetical protein
MMHLGVGCSSSSVWSVLGSSGLQLSSGYHFFIVLISTLMRSNRRSHVLTYNFELIQQVTRTMRYLISCLVELYNF